MLFSKSIPSSTFVIFRVHSDTFPGPEHERAGALKIRPRLRRALSSVPNRSESSSEICGVGEATEEEQDLAGQTQQGFIRNHLGEQGVLQSGKIKCLKCW